MATKIFGKVTTDEDDKVIELVAAIIDQAFADYRAAAKLANKDQKAFEKFRYRKNNNSSVASLGDMHSAVTFIAKSPKLHQRAKEILKEYYAEITPAQFQDIWFYLEKKTVRSKHAHYKGKTK